jgi:SAM-dependent methyltransferase
MNEERFYDKDYYENGLKSRKSLYENYRWLPDLTIPLAEEILINMKKSKTFSLMKNPVVLDFGCAKGFLVKAFREIGVDAYGVDISDYAISQSDSAIKPYIRCLDLTSLPYPDSWPPVDYIVAKDVLEHLSKEILELTLKELRSISPRILVVVPLGDGNNYYIEEYESDPSHKIREELDWWENILVKNGFRVSGTYEVGNLKASWKNHHPRGNGLLFCEE